MPRLNEYLSTFMAGIAYPALYSQIVNDIDNLEDQRRYIDGLISQEDQNLRLLEQQFSVPPQDMATLKALLEDQRRNLIEQGRIAQDIGRTGALAGGDLTTEMQRGLNQALGSGSVGTANDWMRANIPNMNPAQKQTVLAAIAASGFAPQQKESITEAASNTAPGATGGVSREQREGQTELQRQGRLINESIIALGQAGASGIYGLERGQAEIDRRGEEGDRLLRTYLAALDDDGVASADEFASEEDLAAAQEVYDRARETGAYRNDQRRFFEQTYLDAKARKQALEAEREALARPIGMTRQDEIGRRYWEAKGYDFDAPYLAQQKEWYYQNMIRGDEIYEAGLEASRRLFEEDPDRFVVPQGYVVMLTPDNEAQRLARDYVVQRFQSGERTLSMGEARRQLRKVLSGDDLDEALAFAHAYNRGLNQNVSTPDDAEREMEQMRAARREQEEAFQRVKQADLQIREAEDLEREMEAQQQAAVSEFRDQTTASNRALVNLTNSLMMREPTGADGLFPVDERSRLAGTRLSINQGLNVITDPSLDYESMLKALDQLGFREADLENLSIAAGATIREKVRNASPRELAYMSQNPVYAQYIDQSTLQNAQDIMDAERENVINRARALEEQRETGFPVRPEQRRVPRFRPQEVPAPGEGITTTPIDPTDFMLARQEAAPEFGAARSARIQQQQERVDGLFPPSPPARQPPTLTEAQRAVFSDLDDDTLRTLANRSTFAAQELALRTQQQQQQAPAQSVAPEPEAQPTLVWNPETLSFEEVP
jgi:hypothetical protein